MKKMFFKSIFDSTDCRHNVLLAGCTQTDVPADAKNIEPKQEKVTQEKPKPVPPQEKWDIDTPDSITVVVSKKERNSGGLCSPGFG